VLRQAIMCCRKGGTVSIPGVYVGMADKLPIGAAMNKGLTIKTGQTHVQAYTKPLLAQIEEFVPSRARLVTGEDQLLATLLAATIVHPTDTGPLQGQPAAQNVLKGQRTVVHRELTRFRGRQVSTTEDGLLAAFLSPSRAMACADAIRTAIAPLGLDLATGIHTGECDTTAADDLSGLPVDVAVRVAALADPGQVLVTSMVKDLIAGTHLTFSLHGVASLSGVPGEWTLYAVDTPGPAQTAHQQQSSHPEPASGPYR